MQEVLLKIKDPSKMQHFFDKANLIPRKAQNSGPPRVIRHDYIIKDQKKHRLGNNGIPLLPVHKMDLIEKNKI